MSKEQELSGALLAEGERTPLDYTLREVRIMIEKQESRARFWTKLCLLLWMCALGLLGLSVIISGPWVLAIMPFIVALAVLSTIRLLFTIRSGNINRTRKLLLELRADVQELKARQNG